MATALASAPEQGQLVGVRSRNWIVNEVVPGTLPTTGVRGISDPQTFVSLTSVEDDGPGQEIRVVWELDPGARLIEKTALPESDDSVSIGLTDAFVGVDRQVVKLKILAHVGNLVVGESGRPSVGVMRPVPNRTPSSPPHEPRS